MATRKATTATEGDAVTVGDIEAPAIDYQAECERLRAAILNAATRIEQEVGSRWGEEKFNEGAQAAARIVRAILA